MPEGGSPWVTDRGLSAGRGRRVDLCASVFPELRPGGAGWRRRFADEGLVPEGQCFAERSSSGLSRSRRLELDACSGATAARAV